jgi:hypothetical protein
LLGGLAGQIGPWQIFVCVSHVDKINTLMIINSIFILLLLPLVLPWWHFPLHFPLCAGDKKNEEERKKDLKIKIV